MVIRYSVRDLPAAWTVQLSALPVTASEADFELVEASVEIPAGKDLSGKAAVRFQAAADPLFAEGDETVAVRFVPDPALEAGLGEYPEIVILEAGASPCPGVRISALPPSETGPGQTPGLTTEVRIERSEVAASVRSHFAGPYFSYVFRNNDVARGQPMARRRYRRVAGRVPWARHDSRDGHRVAERAVRRARSARPRRYWWLVGSPDLRLRFSGGGCDGRAVATRATRSATGCELTR